MQVRQVAEEAATATIAVSAPRPVPAIEMTGSPQATKPPSTTSDHFDANFHPLGKSP